MQKVSLYRSPWLRAIVILLCILLAAFIFVMSAEPATVSGERSTGIAARILAWIFPDLAAGESDAWLAAVLLADRVLRKTAHFCVYAALGALLCLASLGFPAPLRRHYRLPLGIGVLYAASDELHQAFVPGRGPAVGDVALDGVGVLFGIAVVLLLARRIWKKKKTNRC